MELPCSSEISRDLTDTQKTMPMSAPEAVAVVFSCHTNPSVEHTALLCCLGSQRQKTILSQRQKTQKCPQPHYM